MLSGTTLENLALDPLTVQHFDNRLYMLLYDLEICKIIFIIGEGKSAGSEKSVVCKS